MEIAALGTSLLRIVLLLLEMWRDRKQESVGYAAALKDALDQAHRDLAMADAERKVIADGHAADSTDNAFDPEFRRP